MKRMNRQIVHVTYKCSDSRHEHRRLMAKLSQWLKIHQVTITHVVTVLHTFAAIITTPASVTCSHLYKHKLKKKCVE